MIMIREKVFDYKLRLDYEGSYEDSVSGKSLPALSLRIYIVEDVMHHKKLGVSISTDVHDNSLDLINELCERVGKWAWDYGVTFDLKDEIKNRTEVVRKIENWLTMSPLILQNAKTFELD